jgi:hypothetical protein
MTIDGKSKLALPNPRPSVACANRELFSESAEAFPDPVVEVGVVGDLLFRDATERRSGIHKSAEQLLQ